MAPDFEYFLRGQPSGMIGHTLPGFLFINLPLVIVLYFIYHKFVHETLLAHLPYFLQDSYTQKLNLSRKMKMIVLCYSALIGMFTHIIWDSFTHENGFMVMKIPILYNTILIFSLNVPIYKILQHGSTLFGLTIIIVYMLYRAHYHKGDTNFAIKPMQKGYYWTAIMILSVIIIMLWYAVDFVTIRAYGVTVVRIFDSMLLSLFIVTFVFRQRLAEDN